MKFLVFDVETANYEPTSICQLGMVLVEDGKVIDSEEFIIKPTPNYFIKEFSDMHGITSETVKDSPEFPEVWEKMKHYFDKMVPCIAHNASFDFTHLKALLEYYGIDCPHFPVLCTLLFAKSINNLNVSNYKLKTLCEYFNIHNQTAHTALSDALATTELFYKLIEFSNFDLGEIFGWCFYNSFHRIELKKPKKRTFERITQREIVSATAEFDVNHPLFDKTIVITGALNHLSRGEAYQFIKNVGGFCGDCVTKKTNYLVTNSTDMTGKMKKALEYQEQGQDIKIINEEEFYILLNNHN